MSCWHKPESQGGHFTGLKGSFSPLLSAIPPQSKDPHRRFEGKYDEVGVSFWRLCFLRSFYLFENKKYGLILSEEVAIQLHTFMLLKATYINIHGDSKHWHLRGLLSRWWMIKAYNRKWSILWMCIVVNQYGCYKRTGLLLVAVDNKLSVCGSRYRNG